MRSPLFFGCRENRRSEGNELEERAISSNSRDEVRFDPRPTSRRYLGVMTWMSLSDSGSGSHIRSGNHVLRVLVRQSCQFIVSQYAVKVAHCLT